jgi:hypothetical protein
MDIVIPAQAGIQLFQRVRQSKNLDSRLRGNDAGKTNAI